MVSSPAWLFPAANQGPDSLCLWRRRRSILEGSSRQPSARSLWKCDFRSCRRRSV